MKIKSLIIALFAMLAVFACKEAEPVVEPVLEVGTEKMTFNSYGGERSVSITANNSWTIEDDADWISVSPNSGDASAEKQQVMVYVDENKAVNTDPRVGKITIKSDKLTHEIEVSQSAAEFVPELTVSVGELEASAGAESLTFTITSNVAWTAAEDAEWITLAPTSGQASEEATTVTVTVEENGLTEERTAVITVSGEGVEEEFTLTQSAKEAELTGAGTESDPYVLSTARHMVRMRELATYGGETWFRMAKDIDMSGVTDYVPVNNVVEENATAGQTFERKIHFDGGNFTISNFTCDDTDRPYPSLFGVLYGSVKDLKVVNATITSTGQVVGILGGYVGTTDRPATVTNVDVQGTVTSSVGRSGGFAGNVVDATFTDCNADVTVNGTQDVGGFVGKVQGESSFTRCRATVDVTATVAGNARSGGFIGWNAGTKTTITECKVLAGSKVAHTGSLASAGETSCGGFIGYGDGAAGAVLTVSGCSTDVQVTVTSMGQSNSCFIGQFGYASTVTVENSSAKGKVEGEQNYHAGLIGRLRSSNVTLKGCSFSGTVKGRAGVGGLVGAVENNGVLKVSGSNATGSVTNTQNNCGGLVGLIDTGTSLDMTSSHFDGTVSAAGYGGGIVGGAKGGCILTCTYSTGTVSSSGAYTGGLVGASMNDAVTITDCFSTAKVSAWGQQVGGLVGTTTNKLTMSNCYASGDVYSATSGAAGLVGRVQKSSKITNCIAWNKNISTSRTANNVYAPGGVLGCAQEAGTYSGCWRRYDMDLVDEWISLYDQPDYVNAMPPLPSYSTATHQQAYHGKAAAPGATIASVAQSLGWDSNIWNFAAADSAFGFTIKVLGDNKIEF